MRRDPPSRTSLLVRNIPRTVTGDDLRYHAEKYGPVRDVYLPKDYYTGEPRGIGFVEFTNGRDAEDAKYGMDGMTFNGRQPISVVFALQGRKRPEEYRRERAPQRSSYRGDRSYGGGGGRRRSYSRSPRRSASRSPRRRSVSRSPRRSASRSRSPPKRQYRRSVSRSPERERDEFRRAPATRSPPPRDSRSPPRSRGRSDEEDDYDRRD